MTEEKQLLFKDLCARIPYHVKVKVWLNDGTTEEGPLDLEHNYGNVLLDAFYYNKIKEIKPYLRSLSSMTEEERKFKLSNFFQVINTNIEGVGYIPTLNTSSAISYIDWLNEHHFDYRGLIEKGLAIEASEGTYKIE